MSGLALTYGGCEYWDRTGSLMDGSIRPAGIDLNYIVVTLYDLFRRMARNEEFDAAEMSMSTFIAMVASGDRRFVAIPVFPSRNFRHSYLFVNAAAGIDRPEDLRARRIGVPQYEMTAALWIRAILQHDHGGCEKCGLRRWRNSRRYLVRILNRKSANIMVGSSTRPVMASWSSLYAL